MGTPWKEIVIVLVWLVQLSFMIGIYRSHIKHNTQAIKDNKKSIDELYSKTNKNTTEIAKIQGRLNSQK